MNHKWETWPVFTRDNAAAPLRAVDKTSCRRCGVDQKKAHPGDCPGAEPKA